MVDNSAYRAVSIGVVLQDKEFDSDMLIVSPLEVLSIQGTGIIAPEGTGVEYRSDKDSVTQDVFTSEYSSSSSVEAKWKPIGITNRKTSPDMVANELVMLYKYGNEDEYYWSEYNDTRELKKLERVITRFSNLSAGGDPGTILTDDNSYTVTVSTKDKYLRIHIPNNDGEATTWDIVINTATGVLTIEDGEGNNLNWNAVSGELEETFNTKITRNAPTIIDNCETHIINSSTSEHSTSSYTINADTATYGTLTNNDKDISSTHRHPSGPPFGITGTPL